MNKSSLPLLAFVAAGLAASGLALSSLPASAATGTHAAPYHGADTGKPLTTSELSQVRERQRQLIARNATAPTVAKAVTTFTVNTTEDSDLAAPTGTTCVDAATGRCSLRAAVNAANNRAKPVTIVLGKHTYTLSTATQLTVTNPQGTSIVGQGAGNTTINGSGSRVFIVSTAVGAPSGLLFVSDAKVTGGSTDYGAAFYLDDSNAGATLVLDHVVVTGNAATVAGGGVYASDYDSVYATDSRFTNNESPSGAGIYSYWSDLNLTHVKMTGNHSPTATAGYGGAIYNEYGVLRIHGGSLSGNSAGNTVHGYGAALYDQYGNVSLTKVHVDGNNANAAGDGGALYLYYDLVEVNGGTMSHNRANGQYSSGGAIYVDDGAQLDLHGVTMAGNKIGGPVSVGYGGGAIYLYGDDYGNQLTIDSGTTITRSNAGAVYAYNDYGQTDLSVDHASLSHNHNGSDNGMSGYGCGGAICTDNTEYSMTNLSLTHSTFVGNVSTGNTGSGAVSVYAEAYGGSTVTMKKNRFEDNVAGTDGYGGAVLFYDNDDYTPISVRSQSNTFVGNKAGSATGEGWGGAMAMYYYVAFTDKGSTFSKNVAVGDGAYGGAISDESYQSSRFIRTRFTHNRAGSTGSGDGYGGAVYTEDEAGTAFSKVTVSGNRAASYGGGVYGGSDAYELSFEQSTVSGNTAGTSTGAGYGGGINASDAVLTLENSTVANNVAKSISGTPGQGGGIYHSGSTFGLRYTTVSGNIAKQGGGIYSNAYGGNILSSIVSKNKDSVGGSEQDCSAENAAARLHSLGGNVLGKKSCVTAKRSSDKISKNPKLGKLKDNGGPTRTMAISQKSPAVGRATFQVPATDQRGHDRPAHHADSGAYELPKVKH